LNSKKDTEQRWQRIVQIIEAKAAKSTKAEPMMKRKIEQQKKQKATLAETLRRSETARRWLSQK
jgi:fumarylacetoacetate (FAA) hydrolase family protein